jgi:hypothetical protein
MNLRKNSWLIGQSESESLSGCIRLPTNKNILARYVHLRSESVTVRTTDILKNIFSELQVVWDKSGIPTKPDRKCVDQLLRLFKRWDAIKRIDKKNRAIVDGPSKEKIDKFEEDLSQLCDISASDSYEQLSKSRRPNWKEDWSFLENQRGSRTFFMSQLDSDVSEFAQRQLARKSSYELQKQRASKLQSCRSRLTDDEIRQVIDEVSGDEDASELFTPSRSKKRKTAASISLNIPSRQLSEVVTPAADRSGLSIRQQLLIQSTIVTSSGGSLDEMSMSVSTVLRQRRVAREKTVAIIREKWSSTKPKFGVLHWDSKLIQLLSGRKEEHVAVLVSGSAEG